MQNPIRRLRIKIGITQKELAEYLGLRKNAVSNWEVGCRYPRRPFRQKLLILARKYNMEDEILRYL